MKRQPDNNMENGTLPQESRNVLTPEQRLEEIEIDLHRFDADAADPGRDLVKLVLTLVELIRRLMERQAIRRMEGDSLTDAEIERLGMAFQKMEVTVEELKSRFGFCDGDLNIDLGPLGKLL
jgi:hypothetical protein